MGRETETGKRAGWRQWSEAEARRMVRRWEGSGLSAAEFCEREGVNPERLRRWRRRLDGSSSSELLELRVRRAVPSPVGGVREALGGMVRSETGERLSCRVEVSLDPIRIRLMAGTSREELTWVLRTLGEVSRCG